jgi:hypothetical protein
MVHQTSGKKSRIEPAQSRIRKDLAQMRGDYRADIAHVAY